MTIRNSCTFLGNLGSDLELRYTASGTAMATANIAVNDPKKTDDGWEDQTTWVSLTFFGAGAERAANSLKKGDQILVSAKYSKNTVEGDTGPITYHNFIVDQWTRVRKGKASMSSPTDEEPVDDEMPF